MEGNRRKSRRHTILPVEKFGGHMTEVQERIERRERLVLLKTVREKNVCSYIREGKRRDWNENVFARPSGVRQNAEIAISCRGPGPTNKKKEVYQ